MAKGIVWARWCAGEHWYLWKTKKEAKKHDIDSMNWTKYFRKLSKYVNRPLKKKKIYRITCKEA